jgi:DNA polymerase
MTGQTERRLLFLDTETYSSVDITKAGAFKYMEAPDFEVLLLPYAWDDEPVRVLDLTEDGDPEDREILQDILSGLKDPSTVKIAHNSAFERAAYRRQFGFYQPPEEWEDTMIQAAMNGLPMSLDAAGEALQIQNQKIKEGKALINYFCKPCKPTIANGGRTRNLPHHAPEKWAKFKEYARVDVVAMREIYKRLSRFPVPEWERQVWALDARINERGVLTDQELVASAIAVDEAFRAEHMEELQKLTGLDNPNSVAQLKEWLEGVGVNVDSLDKATVSDLRASLPDPTTRRVLELRQLLGKTSTKKYEAMAAAACDDDRVRGLLQYYGAGRTGRWAGRLCQVQNLPQNHLEQIDKVRELVRDRDLETLELAFDNVPDVLSQLIRTAFVAKPGHTFLVSDYAAIEARVIAYLAGEKWRMDVFAQGGDIYCSSASQMFKVPVVKHGENGHLRQKGKIAELACIAEGQKVLTDHGLVPIEAVTTKMKVWDGVEWVNHAGVICRGEKEVLTYGGLEATADHVVWAEIDGRERPVPFGDAATRGARLTKTGAGGNPIRLGGDNQPGKALECIVEPLLRADQVQRLRGGAVAAPGQSTPREIERLPELLPAEGGATLAGSPVHCSQATMHEPEGHELQKLRRAGDRVPLRERDGGLSVHDRDARTARARYGAGSDRRQRALRTGEPQVGNPSGELSEPAPKRYRVYDIINAGPRHRFTVSDVLVHNCGYGGGVAALKAFGADKMGLTEEEMQTIVTQWRAASPTIPRFWRDAETMARFALENPGGTFQLRCGVKYRRDADALRCRLPSGRVLSYWDARLENGSITFMGQNQTTRKWERMETWGGKLVENIVQAYARDCLAVAMLRLDAAGYPITFHVHDEIIAEMPEGSRWEDMAEIMGQPIDWAPGLLLRGDGYETKFYMKD